MSDYRLIPSIEELRHRPVIQSLEERFGAAATVDALRAAASGVREAIGRREALLETAEAVAARIEGSAAAWLRDEFRASLEKVINATGVILHTNLGRAPLAASALRATAMIAGGYSTLEYNVRAGSRSRRDLHAEALLCRLTGAEAAVVANNNAAAVLLVLAALGAGREVLVSRGELVEIGGGFRVPDVLAQSGATLREVGTTNKTRAADYAAAINDRSALILRVHPSNFRLEGFAERPTLAELVALGQRFGLPVVEDLGSGHLGRHAAARLQEPGVPESLAAGIDVCCFSGDKLLGGPQAGIIVGRRHLVERVGRHPLMRALRVDKMTYAALEATLVEYASGRAGQTIPVQRMLSTPSDDIRRRAQALAGQIGTLTGWQASLLSGASAVGGGSAPGVELPTWLVALERAGLSPDGLDERLRALVPPLIARIEDDRVLLDLRTVAPEDDQTVLELLKPI